MAKARYDEVADWYREFRPTLPPEEASALERLLGRGVGRCLDVGCGAGVASEAVASLGWSVVGVDVSAELLDVARRTRVEVAQASADALPFPDGSFDAAISVWTHTDIDDFPAAVAEIGRVLRSRSPFVYVGAHPCFVGPHSLFVEAKGVPTLHTGYRTIGRYDESAPGIANPDGVRTRVGGVHLPLGAFLGALTAASFTIERFEELGERDYPHAIAVKARS